MHLIITLYECTECPSWCHRFRYTAVDVVRAIHELLYPGSNVYGLPSTLLDIAKAYLHTDSIIAKHVYSLGSDIERYGIAGVQPGVVKVYEKNNYNRMAG